MPTTASDPASADVLTVREHLALQLWGRRWRYAAARDTAARHLLGMGGTALALKVAELAERPAAIAAYPAVTARIRAARTTTHRAARTPRAA